MLQNLRTGEMYHDTDGEHKIGKEDFANLRECFPDLVITRWRALALLSVLMGGQRFWQRTDWLLFHCVPFVRRLGDQAILVMHKE